MKIPVNLYRFVDVNNKTHYQWINPDNNGKVVKWNGYISIDGHTHKVSFDGHNLWHDYEGCQKRAKDHGITIDRVQLCLNVTDELFNKDNPGGCEKP